MEDLDPVLEIDDGKAPVPDDKTLAEDDGKAPIADDRTLAKDDGSQITIEYAEWQKIIAVQMLLARYLRLIAEPPELED